MSAQFVKDVNKIINHMQGNCDFLKFELSGVKRSTTCAVLTCHDADDLEGISVTIRLAVGYDADGQGIEVNRDHGSIYHVGNPDDMDYVAEIIVKKAAKSLPR